MTGTRTVADLLEQRLRQLGLVEIVHGGGVRVLPWRDTGGIGLLPLILWR